MTVFNNLLEIAQNPSAQINKIMQERRLPLALLGYFTGALSVVMASSLAQGLLHGKSFFVFSVIFVLGLNLCLGFFLASSAHLLLELTTGKGRAAGLFVLIGLSEFAKTLLVAFALIARALPAAEPFGPLVTLLALLLQLFFILFLMQKAYGLGKIKTFFALAASLAPAFISMFLIAGFVIIVFLKAVIKLFS
ncbi:MAG: hypothetical protein LBR90_00115 [Elusimicrobiota bacterium]|jgi:hypothetical protein|nr:hypothetical protein [Elusimicrobiota bacterium]